MLCKNLSKPWFFVKLSPNTQECSTLGYKFEILENYYNFEINYKFYS